ncbi:invasion associated locus B family protein [Tabrizicola sp.]|jgi:invasion protein IalB|uniref:invasion associated locus B family protein n=1 Tax=Tabrizicola sp. TaxID=2005166 RepID=UPI0025D07861|nr:invasion associated locus B family protein [Tabrizicola sp.]MBY0352281.1 invasion associated locus B family protein [Tabrizicola sp.]MDK2774096.1 invasion associated locus B family protein [Tabrizicola sp.]
MAKTTSTALALMLALTAAPLAAQTTDAPAEGTGTVTADAPTQDNLAMGKEVAAADGPGSTYTAASFEAWEQRCVRTESGIDPCQLYLLLKDKNGNSVAEFTIFNLPKGSEGPAVAGATFIAPLETLLPAGMMLQVDSAKAKGYPFSFCTQIGCVSRIGFTDEEIAAMKAGGTAKIVIVPFVAPNEKVELTMSLKGFTAGYDAVMAANDAADAATAKSADGKKKK